MTPLHWAVEREHAEVMAVLLEHGADPNAISKFNKTPISLALEHERLDYIDILQQEREIVNIQTNSLQSAEIEAATQNLIKLEAEEVRENENHVEYVLPQKQKQGEFVKLIISFHAIRGLSAIILNLFKN